VERNVRNFIKIRNAAQQPCRIVISVSTLANFTTDVAPGTCTYPDDSNEVAEKWRSHLRPDDVIQVNTAFWRWTSPYVKNCDPELACPMVGRFETDCFVATDGALYLCCLDYRTSIRFESVREKSLTEIFDDESRRRLIDLIRSRNWESAGFPCDSCPSRQKALKVKMDRGWYEPTARTLSPDPMAQVS